jgi:hypothetical protein
VLACLLHHAAPGVWLHIEAAADGIVDILGRVVLCLVSTGALACAIAGSAAALLELL